MKLGVPLLSKKKDGNNEIGGCNSHSEDDDVAMSPTFVWGMANIRSTCSWLLFCSEHAVTCILLRGNVFSWPNFISSEVSFLCFFMASFSK
jgi:hypothetical protein